MNKKDLAVISVAVAGLSSALFSIAIYKRKQACPHSKTKTSVNNDVTIADNNITEKNNTIDAEKTINSISANIDNRIKKINTDKLIEMYKDVIEDTFPSYSRKTKIKEILDSNFVTLVFDKLKSSAEIDNLIDVFLSSLNNPDLISDRDIEWHLIRPLFEKILSKYKIEKVSADKIINNILSQIETYELKQYDIWKNLINPIADSFSEKVVQELCDKHLETIIRNYSDAAENDSIFGKKLTDEINNAILSYEVPSYSIRGAFSNKVDDICKTMLNSINLTEEEENLIKETFIANVAAIITKETVDTTAKNIIHKFVSNEIYELLRKDDAFWDSINIEVGLIRSEAILFAEYERIKIDSNQNNKIKNFAFLVKRDVQKAYSIYVVFLKNNDTVVVQKARLCKKGVSKYMTTESNLSFDACIQGMQARGYLRLTENEISESKKNLFDITNNKVSHIYNKELNPKEFDTNE